MERPTHFFGLNLLYLASLLGLFFFSTSAFSAPAYNLESCSKSSGDCYQDDTANGWANTSTLDGWATSNINGWYANEKTDYRFDISLPAAADAATYFVRVEHDNLESGVTGYDGASSFYVGGGANSSVTEGQMTKHCTAIPGGSSLPTLPYQGDECVVAGPTYTGVDDDGDGRVDEEVLNGIDDDGDGLIDEDPMPDCASSTGAQHIQYTAEVHFDSSEAGSSSSNWGLYWLSHLAVASNNFPGGSVETWVRAHREGDPDDPAGQCPATPNVPVADAPAVYCEGATATIVGRDGPGDYMVGTSGNDVMFGLGGPDDIFGRGGNDTLCGGNGADYLYGEDGDDVLEGGAANDHLIGGPGNDQLFDDVGKDWLVGGDGNDLLEGGANDDHLNGDAGNDQLFGGDGDDYVSGGDDDDVVDGGAGLDHVHGDAGNDQVYGGDGDDYVHGDDGDDVVHGDAGADTVVGDAGNDQLFGDADDDALNGSAGVDALDGGTGTDTCNGGLDTDTDTATNCEQVTRVP